MSNWSDLAARVNAAQLRTFGEPITYEVVGAPAFSITAVRNVRDPLENEQLAAFESIFATAGQFAAVPAAGDVVTIGDMPYVVHAVKPDADPASDGIKIYLNRRLAS